MAQDTLSKISARRYASSSSFVLALFFSVLLGLSIVILGYFMYHSTRDSFIEGTEATLDAEIHTIEAWYSMNEMDRALQMLVNSQQTRKKPIYYILLDKQEKKLAGNLRSLPPAVTTLPDGIMVFYAVTDDIANNSIQVLNLAAKIHTFDDGRQILMAHDITDGLKHQNTIQWIMALSILFLLIVIITSFVISTFVVRRINTIGEVAKGIIKTGDLSRRIEISSRWDDLSNLAYVLNILFDRIEYNVQGIQHVTNNVAHDLRTPLTRLRNSLEMFRKQLWVREDTEALDACDQMVQEADQLINSFNAILRISNIESGKNRARFARLELDSVIRDVIELYDPLVEEKRIQLQVNLDAVTCSGDRDLLFQALANLVDNAIKFTPERGYIVISLSQLKDHPVIVIQDSGPGIPEQARKKVFDRFYRLEESRNTPGNGLGLSLVAAVVDLHQGEIVMEDGNPGLLIRIVL